MSKKYYVLLTEFLKVSVFTYTFSNICYHSKTPLMGNELGKSFPGNRWFKDQINGHNKGQAICWMFIKDL